MSSSLKHSLAKKNTKLCQPFDIKKAALWNPQASQFSVNFSCLQMKRFSESINIVLKTSLSTYTNNRARNFLKLQSTIQCDHVILKSIFMQNINPSDSKEHTDAWLLFVMFWVTFLCCCLLSDFYSTADLNLHDLYLFYCLFCTFLYCFCKLPKSLLFGGRELTKDHTHLFFQTLSF